MLNFIIKGRSHIQELRISCQKENQSGRKTWFATR